jgi:glutathione S-transferase
LEAKYPAPALMPSQAEDIATARMMKMVAVQELQPVTIPLTRSLVGLETDDRQLNLARG